MVLIVGGALAGCSRGPSEEELKKAELEQQFVTIQQLNDTLQQTRNDLAEARATVAEIEAVPERRRSEEQESQLAELETRIGELTTSVDSTFEELQAVLAEFLNVALNEFPGLPQTEQALTIYSDEAIVVANDIVAKSGDYKKAMDHLTSASALYEAAGLGTYPLLKERIESLDDWRFIVQERFDAVKNGMTKDEVKEVAGVPYYQNIQVDEKRGVEMWLYRKREGGAAAVYFKIKNQKVYSKNFDAVKPRVAD
jgi:hypothetical protein